MATDRPQAKVPPEDPKFIKFLFSPDTEYKCYFVVGNPDTNTPIEKIGVVKKMLLSHSEVFRLELKDSMIKEKNNVVVTDLFPHTFKNLLRFVYGHDITGKLAFDDADDLLYAADKYSIDSLKDSVSARLMDLLDTDNICSLLNNPACFRPLQLESAMSKILQYETSKVLSSPEFLNFSPLALLKILEQPLLNVPELDIWRSALQWAKNRAGTEDGPTLRTELSTPLQHIRLCSLTPEEVCSEVIDTKVLTDTEALMVCVSVGTKKQQPGLTSICNQTESRYLNNQLTESEEMEWGLPLTAWDCTEVQESAIKLTTKNEFIKLLSLGLDLVSNQRPVPDPFQWTFPDRCTVTIEGPTLSETNCVTNSPITIHHYCPDRDVTRCNVDVSNNGKAVVLQPNSEYTITVRCDVPYRLSRVKNGIPNKSTYDSSHMAVCIITTSGIIFVSTLREITYKVLTKIGS